MTCAIFAPVPKPPPHLKVQRAKVIVDNEGQKFLTTCDSCREEKYIFESQTVWRNAGHVGQNVNQNPEPFKCCI